MIKREQKTVKLSEIKPNPDNPRAIKRNQLKSLQKSLNDFPEMMELRPIVVDEDGVILGGNMRYQALLANGATETEVETVSGLTPEQKREFIIKDNVAFGDWDWDALANEWDTDELNEWGLDIPEPENVDQEVEEVNVPEAKDGEPNAKRGDIYQLGEHRLICGDSTDVAVIDRLMDGVKADCVFTDPPYNMSDHLTGFANEKTKKALSTIVDFDPNTIINTLFTVDTKNYFIFTSKELIPKYFEIFKGYGFNILVWCKDNPTPMTNNTFLPDVEYLLYFYKNGRVWNNGLDVSVYKKYYNSNKMEGRKEAGNVHPTIKPIKIIADKVQICSNKNGIVVDLFGGSGSTLIACEQLNRKCYMCELDPHYIDVIIQRWEDFTGKKAEKIN